jgi:hypothetical protein
MVSVLASSAVYSGFELRSGQTKDYKTGMCCLSSKHTALWRKNKDWSARNQNNVSEWSDNHYATDAVLGNNVQHRFKYYILL